MLYFVCGVLHLTGFINLSWYACLTILTTTLNLKSTHIHTGYFPQFLIFLTSFLLFLRFNEIIHEKFLFFLTILYCFPCRAQRFYEYQDTRKKNESFAKLPKTEIRADLATFTLSGIDEAVGKEELKKIPFTTFGPDYMNFEGDDIKASVKLSPFDAAKHKLDYDEKYLIRIDKKTYYGNYGNIPKTYISKIVVTIGGDTCCHTACRLV